MNTNPSLQQTPNMPEENKIERKNRQLRKNSWVSQYPIFNYGENTIVESESGNKILKQQCKPNNLTDSHL